MNLWNALSAVLALSPMAVSGPLGGQDPPVPDVSPWAAIPKSVGDTAPEGVVIVVLDQIAAIGRTYPVSWGAPSCSAQRAGLVTGRFAFRPENRMGSNVRESGIFELVPDPRHLPARVTAEGKTATTLGKWHLAVGFHFDHPLDCGYTHWAGTEGNLSWSGEWSYFQWIKIVDGAAMPRTGYITTDTIDDAITEVQAGTDLIVVNLHAPHGPLHCPPPDLAPVTDCDRGDQYEAMIEAVDTELGRLLPEVLANDYTMFITSDNGKTQPFGGKWTVYESGLRALGYAVGHGVAPGVSSHMLSVVDFAPTVLDLLDIPYESEYFDGVSMAQEIGGAQLAPRYLYSEIFPSGAPYGLNHRRAIRDDRWKLHTSYGYPPEEFYDLRHDPHETNNLLEGLLTPDAQAALDALRDHLPF